MHIINGVGLDSIQWGYSLHLKKVTCKLSFEEHLPTVKMYTETTELFVYLEILLIKHTYKKNWFLYNASWYAYETKHKLLCLEQF